VAATTGWTEWLAFIGLPLELSSSHGVTIHSCAVPQDREGAGTSTEHASKRRLQKGQMKIVSVPVLEAVLVAARLGSSCNRERAIR
jgi:hypothetical protein